METSWDSLGLLAAATGCWVFLLLVVFVSVVHVIASYSVLIELGLGLYSQKTVACFKSSDLLGPVISWTISKWELKLITPGFSHNGQIRGNLLGMTGTVKWMNFVIFVSFIFFSGVMGGTAWVQQEYREGTIGVLRGYNRGTGGVQGGNNRGAGGVQEGYRGGVQ